jgi:hypothetical protein
MQSIPSCSEGKYAHSHTGELTRQAGADFRFHGGPAVANSPLPKALASLSLSTSKPKHVTIGICCWLHNPTMEHTVRIHTGAGMGASRSDNGMDSTSRIAMLKSQIKQLDKKIETLRKILLEGSPDPETRLLIMKQIMDLQEMQRMCQAQIVLLELRDKRKLEHGQPGKPESESKQED